MPILMQLGRICLAFWVSAKQKAIAGIASNLQRLYKPNNWQYSQHMQLQVDGTDTQIKMKGLWRTQHALVTAAWLYQNVCKL